MQRKKSAADLVKENFLSCDDYASTDDRKCHEVVNGKLDLMSHSPSLTHQMISFEINKLITRSCASDYFVLYMPVDVILAENEVLQPDLVLVRRNRVEILSVRGVEGAPDLVVEILSPSALKSLQISLVRGSA